MNGVAYTTGTDLDHDHKELHFNLNYIANTKAASKREELLGVLCHELVHCFQWAANGTCPGGLVEGVADWVRLRAGLAAGHWKQEASGKWDGIEPACRARPSVWESADPSTVVLKVAISILDTSSSMFSQRVQVYMCWLIWLVLQVSRGEIRRGHGTEDQRLLARQGLRREEALRRLL